MRWIALKAGLLVLAAMAADAGAVELRSALPATRVADATSDVCLSRCADASAACKRVCPSTFGIPCQNSCDSQYQSCRQSCQSR